VNEPRSIADSVERLRRSFGIASANDIESITRTVLEALGPVSARCTDVSVRSGVIVVTVDGPVTAEAAKFRSGSIVEACRGLGDLERDWSIRIRIG